MQELIATPLDRLVELPGIGEKTAEKLLAAAQEYIAAHPPTAPEAPVAVELEFTPEMEPAAEAAAVTGAEAEESAPGDTSGAQGGEA